MAQTDMDRTVSFSLFGQRLGKSKRAAPFSLCPVFGIRVSAQVALQRCPILRTSAFSLTCLFIHPLQRGHLYFAE
jgi:hypothetical protein